MCRILALSVSGQSIKNNKDEEIIVRSHGAKRNVEIISVAFLSEIPLKKQECIPVGCVPPAAVAVPAVGGFSTHTHTHPGTRHPPREQNS